MNILIPDSWLRDHLKTDATAPEIMKYLSLCGPSVERIIKEGRESVYDIEITTNRVDAFSVMGIAREAHVILPEFGKSADLIAPELDDLSKAGLPEPELRIKNDPKLCSRILAVTIDVPKVGPSPAWLAKRLEQVGQRPLNAAVDITNYVMWEVGHPVHAFDYDRLTEQTIIVREAKKGETLTTLDGKTHTLQGGEVIFDDGTGTIVDLPGIMGTENTVVTATTKRILLWIEDIDPVRIRMASMGLAIRTQAAVINEKQPDPELGMTAIRRAVRLYRDAAGGTVSSGLTDIYPSKPKTPTVRVPEPLITTYIGVPVPEKRVHGILARLGFDVSYAPGRDGTGTYTVTPPTWRTGDITIAEDVVEEIARIYGYHNIAITLPSEEPPLPIPDPTFRWEDEVKTRLRDWGYTETYTYSMISREVLGHFGFDTERIYKISNILSADQEYLRPSLVPGLTETLRQNLFFSEDLCLFELSNIYAYRKGDLPLEHLMLAVALKGDRFRETKGLAESLISVFGLQTDPEGKQVPSYFDDVRRVSLGSYGTVGLLNPAVAAKLELSEAVTILELDLQMMIADAKPAHTYQPLPKYPPVFEDLTFVVPPGYRIGPLIRTLRDADRLVTGVNLKDSYKDARTFHITYQDPERNLTAEDVRPVRERLIATAEKTGVRLKK